MSQLRIDLNGSSSNRVTYAEMVSRQHNNKAAATPMHTIIVSSGDDQDNNQKVMPRIVVSELIECGKPKTKK